MINERPPEKRKKKLNIKGESKNNEYSEDYIGRFEGTIMKNLSKEFKPELALLISLMRASVLVATSYKLKRCFGGKQTKNIKNKFKPDYYADVEEIEINGKGYPDIYKSFTDFREDLWNFFSEISIKRAITLIKKESSSKNSILNKILISKTIYKHFVNTYYALPEDIDYMIPDDIKIRNGISFGYKKCEYNVYGDFYNFKECMNFSEDKKYKFTLIQMIVLEYLYKILKKSTIFNMNVNKVNQSFNYIVEKDYKLFFNVEKDGTVYKMIKISKFIKEDKVMSSLGISEETFRNYLKIYKECGVLYVRDSEILKQCIEFGGKKGVTFVEKN